ncbi:MAG: yaaA [Paenibacillus sp.]|nr:yaaA [Paenibacillus sp.]
MKKVTITTEYITLGQFLKLADCISTGGEAKSFIQETDILVNDEPEKRRGRKLYPNDRIEVQHCGLFTVDRRG